jgi:hypothetical protein
MRFSSAEAIRQARQLAQRLDRDLTDAGFDHVTVQERPEWLAAEWAMWEEAASLDPGDDPAGVMASARTDRPR